jgi:hypothetical protein
MAKDNSKRNFVLVESNGEETSVFSGSMPRQAALKAARRLPAAPSEDAVNGSETLRLRERGTDKIHVYGGWAWEADAPADKPEWMSSRITKANVSKQGIEHQD